MREVVAGGGARLHSFSSFVSWKCDACADRFAKLQYSSFARELLPNIPHCRSIDLGERCVPRQSTGTHYAVGISWIQAPGFQLVHPIQIFGPPNATECQTENGPTSDASRPMVSQGFAGTKTKGSMLLDLWCFKTYGVSMLSKTKTKESVFWELWCSKTYSFSMLCKNITKSQCFWTSDDTKAMDFQRLKIQYFGPLIFKNNGLFNDSKETNKRVNVFVDLTLQKLCFC